MNAQQNTQSIEEKNLIWIQRPYFYFTLPQIRMLCKKEAKIDSERWLKWMETYRKDPKLAGQFKPSRLFYIYEQMLTLSIPTKGRLKYNEKVYYTPALLAGVLEGDFTSEDIEEAITILEKYLFLITIEDDKTIVINLFNDFFSGFSGETTNDDIRKDDSLDAAVEKCINKLIEHNYITSDHKELSDFKKFFKEVLPMLKDLSLPEIEQIIGTFATSGVKKAKRPIDEKFKYFEPSFRDAINRYRTEKKKKEFAEACESTKKDWI